MSAHPSERPARNDEPQNNGIAAPHDQTATLLALADAIEACLQVTVHTDDVSGEERTVALDPRLQDHRRQQPQRVLTTQPLAVQAKPTAIFASRLPAHFIAAPGIELAARASSPAPAVPVVIAETAPAKAAVEPPRKQTLFVQPPRRRSKAPWLAAVALLVAVVGAGGYVQRGRLQLLRAQMSAKPAPAPQVAQVAQPVASPIVAAEPVPAPVLKTAQPVAVAAVQPAAPIAQTAAVAQPIAQPAIVAQTAVVAQPEPQAVTARVKHRETHARKPDPKPAADTAQASNDAKPEPRGEPKPDMKAAADAMLKAQLDSAL